MAEIQSIASLAALDELLERSKERPVWIFKHSLTCGISSSAWAEFRRRGRACRRPRLHLP